MNNEKSINFATHAKQRLIERKISQEDAEKVIRKGKPIGWRNGSRIYAYYSNVVVFDDKGEDIQVITVYKLNRTLEQRIEMMAQPYEWFKEDNKRVFIHHAYYLLDKGLEMDEVLWHLEELYNAVCGEFGQ